MVQNPATTSSIPEIECRIHTNDQYGRLRLSGNCIEFKTGTAPFGRVIWHIDLPQIADIRYHTQGRYFTDLIITIQSALGHDTTFHLPLHSSIAERSNNTPAVKRFVQAVQHRLYARHQITVPGYTPPAVKPSPTHPPSPDHSALDTAILQIVKAYRMTTQLPLPQLLEILDDEYTLTMDQLTLRLAHLISTQQLPGYLTNNTYHRSALGTLQCQICDQILHNPPFIWQCPDCQRYVCLDDYPPNGLCPSHPTHPTPLQKRP